MAVIDQPFYRDKAYAAVALTHFSVDVMNSGRAILMAWLAALVGLTNTQLGVALLLYNVGSGIAQPFFGWWADRTGPRLLVVGGLAWMIVFYAIASIASEWVALGAVVVAGLGSGAFHPTGTKVASETSVARRTQATAVFFMAGQMGLFLGPVVAGQLLDDYGQTGYIVLPFLGLIALASGWQWVHQDEGPGRQIIRTGETGRQALLAVWRPAIPLAMYMLAGSTASIVTINFAPVLFLNEAYSATYVGWAGGLLMVGSALGGVVGGRLADGRGYRLPLILGPLAAIVPLFLYVGASGAWRFPLLLLAGFFSGMPHSVIVITAQNLLPGRRALASGLTLGFMFSSGAIGSIGLGALADRIGLAPALQLLPLILLLALTAVYWIRPALSTDDD